MESAAMPHKVSKSSTMASTLCAPAWYTSLTGPSMPLSTEVSTGSMYERGRSTPSSPSLRRRPDNSPALVWK